MIIDVSKHDGMINWEKAKSDGVQGAIIRCGYGRDVKNQDDEYFHRNVSECQRLGIPFGVYLYSYAGDVEKAKSEADHVKRLVKGLKLDFPIFYDLEEDKYSSVASKVAKTWLECMKGYNVGIYANTWWWKNYLKDIDCKKWVAAWDVPKPKIENMILWQYDAYGTVNGVGKGSVDLNKPFGEILDIINGNDDDDNDNDDGNDEGGKIMLEVEVLKKTDPTMKGPEVFTVQSILKCLGYKGKNGKVLALDSSFGGNTEFALKNFQEDKGLVVDGICGPKTWDKLVNG